MKQNASSFERDTVSLRVFQKMKKINSQKCSRENWKGLKTDPFCAKHVIFVTETSHVHVARTSRQNTKKKTLKKISKRFLQLEVPLARESRTEPQKSLCTPRNWTFHPRTSRQPEPQKHENPIFEKYSKSFSWLKHLPANESPVSCKKSLYGLATGDWFYPRLSRQNKAKQFLKFLIIFAKTKYFPKKTCKVEFI